MSRTGGRAVLVWLLALVACAAVVGRSHFTADMSAFLPKHPSAEQQLLVEQLKDGSLSRLLLIGIEGADSAGRARLSKELAAHLAANGDFASVRNGDAAALARDREILFDYRYLLSPAVDAGRFTEAGLRQAIGDSIDLLASPAGLMIKGLLARDPTGEMMELLGTLDAGGSPNTDGAQGVWVSRDGRRALLMAQTAASGSDTDGQEKALASLRGAFAAAQAATWPARRPPGGLRHAGLFSRYPRHHPGRGRAAGHHRRGRHRRACCCWSIAPSRRWRLACCRSLSGALAGIAAVSLGFGSVHGITSASAPR